MTVNFKGKSSSHFHFSFFPFFHCPISSLSPVPFIPILPYSISLLFQLFFMFSPLFHFSFSSVLPYSSFFFIPVFFIPVLFSFLPFFPFLCSIFVSLLLYLPFTPVLYSVSLSFHFIIPSLLYFISPLLHFHFFVSMLGLYRLRKTAFLFSLALHNTVFNNISGDNINTVTRMRK